MTDPGLPAERTSLARPLVLGLLGLAALGATAAFVWHHEQPGEPAQNITLPAQAPPPPAPSAAASAAAPLPTGPAPDAPSFDIVRIDPRGDAVLAGHAASGAQVTIQDGAKTIGQVTADAGGNWAFATTTPLPPGARALTLTETLGDGSAVKGAASVLAVVPDAAAPPTTPLALLDQPGTTPRILQAPTNGPGARLALAAVDYDDHGKLRFAGNAPPGAAVRVYIDDQPAGDATADAEGRWTLSPSATIAPGQHRLRLDQLGTAGKVAARVELPFQREQLAADQLGTSRVLVQPGESLWRLARNVYGKGVRYTVIYQANAGQIRDPAKIYPGQLLTVPADSPPAHP